MCGNQINCERSRQEERERGLNYEEERVGKICMQKKGDEEEEIKTTPREPGDVISNNFGASCFVSCLVFLCVKFVEFSGVLLSVLFLPDCF